MINFNRKVQKDFFLIIKSHKYHFVVGPYCHRFGSWKIQIKNLLATMFICKDDINVVYNDVKT